MGDKHGAASEAVAAACGDRRFGGVPCAPGPTRMSLVKPPLFAGGTPGSNYLPWGHRPVGGRS